MNHPEQLRSLSFFVPALFEPLFLSGGGHPILSKAVNLALFAGFLIYVLRKPVREFFAQRLAQVREILDRAKREKEAAQAKMAELDQRLNRLSTELAGITLQAKAEAAAERTRMEAEAKRDLEKIQISAKREIESAKQIAMSELRDFAATKAVDLAEQMIRREMKPEDDARMLRRMADEMSKVS